MSINKDFFEILASNIKYYRKKKNLTQQELAKITGYSHEFIKKNGN